MILLVLLVLVCAFLVIAGVCEYVTKKLGEPAPYTDRSRGTGRR